MRDEKEVFMKPNFLRFQIIKPKFILFASNYLLSFIAFIAH